MYPLVQRFVTAAVCTILTSEESYPKPVLFVQAWWSIHITSKRTGWYWYHYMLRKWKLRHILMCCLVFVAAVTRDDDAREREREKEQIKDPQTPIMWYDRADVLLSLCVVRSATRSYFELRTNVMRYLLTCMGCHTIKYPSAHFNINTRSSINYVVQPPALLQLRTYLVVVWCCAWYLLTVQHAIKIAIARFSKLAFSTTGRRAYWKRRAMRLNPLRTPVPFWGQTTYN